MTEQAREVTAKMMKLKQEQLDEKQIQEQGELGETKDAKHLKPEDL